MFNSYTYKDVLTRASTTIQIIDDTTLYKATIFSSNGNIFNVNEQTSQLTLSVRKGLEDITDQFTDIVWSRFSENAGQYEEDLTWGEQHRGKKTFILHRDDILEKGNIQVSVYSLVDNKRTLVAADYVSFIDINDMKGSTTAPSDPLHGDLWLDTSIIPPKLMMWDNNSKKWIEVTTENNKRNLIRNSNFYKKTFDYWKTVGTPTLEIESFNNKKWARIYCINNSFNCNGMSQTITASPKDTYSYQMISSVYTHSSYLNGNLKVTINSINNVEKTLLVEKIFDITSEIKNYNFTFTSLNDTKELEIIISNVEGENCDFVFTNTKLEKYPTPTEWEIAIEDIQDALDNKVGNSVEEIFDSLTDSGRIQGIYMDGGNIYINGEYINAKNLSVVNSNGTQTLLIDSFGNITIKASSLSIGSNNVATDSSVQESIKDNVKDVQVMYRLSNSEIELTGDYEWSVIAPSWESGKYMWTKTVTTYVSGNTKTDGPTCISGAKGENYRVEIISSNGSIFKNNQIDTTLTAKVYRNEEDITDSINAASFKWVKINADGSLDEAWNSKHFGGAKTIKITSSDIYARATFNCSVDI